MWNDRNVSVGVSEKFNYEKNVDRRRATKFFSFVSYDLSSKLWYPGIDFL